MVAISTLVATSGERLRVKAGVVCCVWKLCDPHLSASAVSFLLWDAIQMSVFLRQLGRTPRCRWTDDIKT